MKLMLLPAKVNSLMKKRDCKKYTFVDFNYKRFKIVLVLLTEVVAVYVQSLIV